jgi:hypothetical protein
MDFHEKLAATKTKLDGVSPSFCLAKWLQVTLHLQNGFNHSCHHPGLHKASREELLQDPSALHNTSYKKEMRAQMLKGERPPECEYCWKVEDAAGGHFSDRTIKSADSWAVDRLDEIRRAPASRNVNPSYVEVSFGNECNFRCSYCGPDISSSLWSSFKTHGPYIERISVEDLTAQGKAPLPSEGNPYVKAFWEWFPALAKDLKVFRITGGEPLVNPNTFKVLDFLEANPQPDLQLCINSNFGIPERLFRKFMERMTALTATGRISKFMMYTSADTHGAHAEYLRVGLDYDLWLERVRTYLREQPWDITVMVTFNTLSVARFPLFLRDMLALNSEFPGKRLTIDISHLRHPEYFSPWILTEPWLKQIDGLAQLMEENSTAKIGASGFKEYEILKMKRVAQWAQTTAKQASKTELTRFRSAFYIFTMQFEAREGMKFAEVFPEMADFYAACEAATGEPVTWR